MTLDSGLIRLEAHLAERPRQRRDSEIRLRRDPYLELVKASQQGDRQALAQLLRVLAPRLRSACRALFGGDHPDIDDVVQEALIAFCKALPAFEGRSTVVHYAYRITVRIGLARKRRSREMQGRYQLLEDPEILEDEDQGNQALSAERREAVRALLETLPAVQAETMALRVCLGMSLAETAAATEAPVNTVRSRLRLAREAMRKAIEEDPALSDLVEGWL